MDKNDFILIFQKPELYFFPHYKDLVYAPYDRKEKTPLYYLYRGMNLFKLSISSFFWGHWKSQLSSAKKVIIFDYGYQNCMEKFIKKCNPNCDVYLFCWNKINKFHNNALKYSEKANIFSTDKSDCEKYNLKYNHIFYPTELHEKWNPESAATLYFIGADKGRADRLLNFHHIFTECGLKSNIRIFSNKKDAAYRNKYHEILTDRFINYTEYINEVRNSGILLDINQEGQQAITMRVLESVVYSKKLITTNKYVKAFSFYNDNNILIIDNENAPSVDGIRQFISKPFIPYTDDQLYEISFEHWIDGFSQS